MNRSRMVSVTVFLFLCLPLLAACGGGDGASNGGSFEHVTEVERQLLKAGEPAAAAGHKLELTRVIVPGGAGLASHTHPGLQLALIVEGTLTYTVFEGTVEVTRAAGPSGARSETISAGTSTTLNPGDSIKEPAGMVHAARNAGDVPVVIHLSSLFPTGAPPSSPAEVRR